MNTYTAGRGAMSLQVALAAAKANPGPDRIEAVPGSVFKHFAVTDSGGLVIDLTGSRVDAAGFEYGILIRAPYTTIIGGEVFGASGHGGVVQRTHHVTIDGTRFHDNDGRGLYLQRSDWLTIKGVEADHNRIGGVSVHYAEAVNGPWAEPWARIKLLGLDVHDNGVGGPKAEQQGLILDAKAQGAPDWTSYTHRILVQDSDLYDNEGPGLLDYGYKRVVVDHTDLWGNGAGKTGTYRTQFDVRGPVDEFVFRHSSAIGDQDGYTGVIRGPQPLRLDWTDSEFVWVGHDGTGVIAVGAPQEMPAPEDPTRHAMLDDHWIW